MPQPTEVMDVVAIQRGTQRSEPRDPDHRPSRLARHRHDEFHQRRAGRQRRRLGRGGGDGGGARAVASSAFAATLVYAVLSGEEQGLYGGKVLADYARGARLAGRGRSQQRHRRQQPRRRRRERQHARCACSPKAPRPSRRRRRPTAAATTAARSIRRSRNLARFMAEPGRSLSDQPARAAWSTAPTATAAAATRCRSSRPASPPCA